MTKATYGKKSFTLAPSPWGIRVHCSRHDRGIRGFKVPVIKYKHKAEKENMQTEVDPGFKLSRPDSRDTSPPKGHPSWSSPKQCYPTGSWTLEYWSLQRNTPHSNGTHNHLFGNTFDNEDSTAPLCSAMAPQRTLCYLTSLFVTSQWGTKLEDKAKEGSHASVHPSTMGEIRPTNTNVLM